MIMTLFMTSTCKNRLENNSHDSAWIHFLNNQSFILNHFHFWSNRQGQLYRSLLYLFTLFVRIAIVKTSWYEHNSSHLYIIILENIMKNIYNTYIIRKPETWIDNLKCFKPLQWYIVLKYTFVYYISRSYVETIGYLTILKICEKLSHGS